MRGPLIRLTARDFSEFLNSVRLFLETMLVDLAFVAERTIVFINSIVENVLIRAYFNAGKLFIKYFIEIFIVLFLCIILLY